MKVLYDFLFLNLCSALAHSYLFPSVILHNVILFLLLFKECFD